MCACCPTASSTHVYNDGLSAVLQCMPIIWVGNRVPACQEVLGHKPESYLLDADLVFTIYWFCE